VKPIWVAWLGAALLARHAAAGGPDALVRVPAEQAAGFSVAAALAGEEPLQTTAIGQVLDPQPFVQAAFGRATARAAAEIAARDRTRVEALARADRNASLRDAEAARLADLRARADLAAAEAQAVGVWGAAALAAPDHDAFVDRLAHGSVSIARLDLPGAAFVPVRAWVSAPALGVVERAARVLGAAPGVATGLQARAVLVALDADPLPVGTALLGRVEADAVARGVEVPASAIVWQGADPFVFVARGPGAFERRAVHVVASRRAGVWIAEGVAPGDPLVVSGAEQLLSAQLVGAASRD
jgi:hypothetical protein